MVLEPQCVGHLVIHKNSWLRPLVTCMITHKRESTWGKVLSTSSTLIGLSVQQSYISLLGLSTWQLQLLRIIVNQQTLIFNVNTYCCKMTEFSYNIHSNLVYKFLVCFPLQKMFGRFLNPEATDHHIQQEMNISTGMAELWVSKEKKLSMTFFFFTWFCVWVFQFSLFLLDFKTLSICI